MYIVAIAWIFVVVLMFLAEATSTEGSLLGATITLLLYGVVPQVVPQFIAFTLYRWDINVRMATVIGLVGGGGIGYILTQYIQFLQWRFDQKCVMNWGTHADARLG